MVEATVPNLHENMAGEPASVCNSCRTCQSLSQLPSSCGPNGNVSWPFLKPVDPQLALDYYDVIIDPIDLSLMRSRLGWGKYYGSLEMFVADMRKMCDNCRWGWLSGWRLHAVLTGARGPPAGLCGG